MRLSASGLFPLLLVIALALLSFWLEHAVREQAAAPAPVRHDPDYIANDFSIQKFNKKGIAESTLAAAKMTHFPDDDSTELLAPYVVQSKPNEPRITVTADRGMLSQDGSDVFLYGHVLLVRSATPTRPEARMRTSFLHIARGGSLLVTDREVVITENDRSLSGRGMEYNNLTGELLLHQNVHGEFVPKSNG
jgi:lipopolysaccharide export system protein LptC